MARFGLLSLLRQSSAFAVFVGVTGAKFRISLRDSLGPEHPLVPSAQLFRHTRPDGLDLRFAVLGIPEHRKRFLDMGRQAGDAVCRAGVGGCRAGFSGLCTACH